MDIIEDNKLPLFNDKRYSYMISTQSGIKNVSKTLSFDLLKNSITSKESDCFPSCCSMAALYWKHHIPNLNLEINLDYWKKFRKKTSFQNIKGVSLKGIYSNLPLNATNNHNEINTENLPTIELIDVNNTNELIEAQLIFIPKTPERFIDLIPPFSATVPILQILIFDDLYSRREITGTAHASILSNVNLIEKKIQIIDPQNFNKEEIIIMRNIDMKEFAKGWYILGNSVIWVYPRILERNLKIESGSTNIKKIKQEEITKYLN